MWFEDLLGFSEQGGPDVVREQLDHHGNRLRSRVNGREFGCGRLEIPTLGDLRDRATSVLEGHLLEEGDSTPSFGEVVSDVQSLHRDPANAGALIQAASQFNLLEMAGPHVTPEKGVGIYQHDHTQGPSCAVAAGAGTVYRNYLVPLADQLGQSSTVQIDCLADMGRLLDNESGRLWTMTNGYALATQEGLLEIGERLAGASEDERDVLRRSLRIGVHWDVEVTLPGASHHVTQVYGSALPVAYGEPETALWEPFARLVLEASYEATLLSAVLNAAEGGSDKVFLTLLGGGVFGNEKTWILDAIEHALRCVPRIPLDLSIVSFSGHSSEVQSMISRIQAQQ